MHPTTLQKLNSLHICPILILYHIIFCTYSNSKVKIIEDHNIHFWTMVIFKKCSKMTFFIYDKCQLLWQPLFCLNVLLFINHDAPGNVLKMFKVAHFSMF